MRALPQPPPNATLLGVLLCLPTAPELPLWRNGDFGTSPLLLGSSLGQAAACQYEVMWGVGTYSTMADRDITC
jgi:hypothetical protein